MKLEESEQIHSKSVEEHPISSPTFGRQPRMQVGTLETNSGRLVVDVDDEVVVWPETNPEEKKRMIEAVVCFILIVWLKGGKGVDLVEGGQK